MSNVFAPFVIPRSAVALASLALVACLAPYSRSAAQQPPRTTTTSQTAPPTAPLSFDAASIKEGGVSAPLGAVWMKTLPGRLTAQCATLKLLLSYAYTLTYSSPIEGLPDWAAPPCSNGTKDTYDFQAIMPPETTPEQTRWMMQSLLAERFKLAVHWEKKTMPVYELVVASGGFKLKPIDPADVMKPFPADAFRCPDDDPQCRRSMMTGTMAQLAGTLAASAGRPVIEKTGITGNYSGILKWAGDTAPNSSLPSFATAVRETFGLELKSETDPVDVLVVDHVEKPTPN